MREQMTDHERVNILLVDDQPANIPVKDVHQCVADRPDMPALLVDLPGVQLNKGLVNERREICSQ